MKKSTFLTQFETDLENYYDLSEFEQDQLLKQLELHARRYPDELKTLFSLESLNNQSLILDIVVEALLADITTWGETILTLVETIFEKVKTYEDRYEYYSILDPIQFHFDANHPIYKELTQRIYKELDADFIPNKLFSIEFLALFVGEAHPENSQEIIHRLQQELQSKNWKVRYISYENLSFNELLPAGSKLAFLDKIRKWVFGNPSY